MWAARKHRAKAAKFPAGWPDWPRGPAGTRVLELLYRLGVKFRGFGWWPVFAGLPWAARTPSAGPSNRYHIAALCRNSTSATDPLWARRRQTKLSADGGAVRGPEGPALPRSQIDRWRQL